MNRIDIRCQCNLKGYVLDSLNKTDMTNQYPVYIKDICIGGAKLTHEKLPEDNRFVLLHIEEQFNINILANIKLLQKQQAVLQFYYDTQEKAQKVLDIVRLCYQKYANGYCPYCGEIHDKDASLCPKTHLSLNITDFSYLTEHVQKTLTKRVNWRLCNVNAETAWHILSSLDKALLNFQMPQTDLEITGTAPAMLDIFAQIRKVATTDLPVLVHGESGTGKELVSRAIFERSGRKDKPFVVINCATMPESLLEAELFGYEGDGFSRNNTSREGKFEHAHKGTLLLDEIGDLPQSIQAKLLRFLEQGTIERLGSNTSRQLDIRILATTNQDLENKINNGNFRLDLFHRLSALTIILPPLRERGQDKIILAKFFLHKFVQKYNKHEKMVFSEDALAAINTYKWPGNVREMINKIRKAVVTCDMNIIKPADLDLKNIAKNNNSLFYTTRKKDIDKKKLLQTLNSCNWNKSLAAKHLNISRPTLYKLTKEYKI